MINLEEKARTRHILHKERFMRPKRQDTHLRIKPFFLDFHKLSMSGRYEYPLHQHTSYEVILVDQGPYRCRLNDVELSLKQDQVLVIKPGDWHQDHLREGQYHYVLHFVLGVDQNPGRTRYPLFADGVSERQQICEGTFEHHIRFFEELERESTGQEAYAAMIQDALLEVFFWRIVRRLPEDVLSPLFRRFSKEQAFLDRINRIFERHSADGLTVDDLAYLMGMSKRTLTYRCQKLLGDSPAHAYLKARIRKAVLLLKLTDQPIKEISYHLGFKNPYHFSRAFKQVLGHPPAHYREAALKA
jgi:AraC-like DNA-binding protein